MTTAITRAPEDGAPALAPVFSERDVTALTAAIAILREFPGARVTSNEQRARLLASVSYTLGYLEATGLLEPSSLLEDLVGTDALPRGGRAAAFDEAVADLEQLVGAAPDTVRRILDPAKGEGDRAQGRTGAHHRRDGVGRVGLVLRRS